MIPRLSPLIALLPCLLAAQEVGLPSYVIKLPASVETVLIAGRAHAGWQGVGEGDILFHWVEVWYRLCGGGFFREIVQEFFGKRAGENLRGG